MARAGDRPYTRTTHPEPEADSVDWLIWAAWSDRVSFEEILERSGLSEAEVIRRMRRELRPGTFRRWRARVSGRATKHRRRFRSNRRDVPSR